MPSISNPCLYRIPLFRAEYDSLEHLVRGNVGLEMSRIPQLSNEFAESVDIEIEKLGWIHHGWIRMRVAMRFCEVSEILLSSGSESPRRGM